MTLALEILKLFENAPTQVLTIHQVSCLLKRTYPFVHKKTNLMVKEGMLFKKIAGKSHLVWPNLKNEKTILYFALNSQEQKVQYLSKAKIKDALNEFTNKLKLNSSVRVIALFGSQAKGRETKKSDIDILVITVRKNREIDDFVLSIANTVNMSFGCQINPVIVDDVMFKEMLKPEELTVGKEVLKAHVILHGFEDFWTLVGGAL